MSEAVVGRRLDDGYVLVNLETQQMFELNSSGARIWELLLEGVSWSELERSLLAEFTGDPSSVRRDARDLLAELVRCGMLREAPTIAPVPETREPSEWMIRWAPDESAPIVHRGGPPHRMLDLHQASGGWTAVAGSLFEVDHPRPARWVSDLRARAGDRFIDGLRGAFLVLTWDARDRLLVVHADPIGVLPCYYAWDGRTLLISSSIDALLAQPEVSREVNRLLLGEYVYGRFGLHQTPETFFAAVKRLPAAHRLSFRDRSLAIDRYWDPLPDGFEWAEEELDRIEALLERAVRRPVSAGADSLALSGGFDSVSVALLASNHATRPLTALSLFMTGTDSDESAIQRSVAAKLGMPLRSFSLPAEDDRHDFVEKALALSSTAPGPVLSIWQWMLAAIIEEAKGIGCSKILMGTGGDEMFNVDPRYAYDLSAAGDLGGLYRFLAAWAKTSPLPPQKVAPGILWDYVVRPRMGSTVKRHLGPVWPHFSRARTRLARDRLKPPAALEKELEPRSPAAQTSYIEAMRALLQSPVLAMELEQVAAWNAHRRVSFLFPFFDRDLVDVALRLRPESLYRSGRMKEPLRRLVTEAMPEVALPKRKVDFTQLANQILVQSAPRAWRTLGGVKRLYRIGAVDLDQVESWMGDCLAGRRSAPAQVWRLLSAEAWLHAREAA